MTEIDGLPVGSLREAVPHLRRPFTPEAVRFKVQSVFRGNAGCLVVAYIDARLATERLNRVCPDLWYAQYETLSVDKLLLCKLTIDGVTRQDVGESPKGLSKDLFSDALKRAAVQFGVGVSIYALPQITLYRNATGLLEERGGEKKTLVLTEKGHTKLREGYTRWLEEHGKQLFGEPLGHGDVEGATFDEDAEVEEFAPAPAPALEDEEATALREQAKAAYKLVDHRELPPGRFHAWLAGAAWSHDELRRLVAELQKRVPAEVAS